ncbi:hypothetical protein QYM36_017526 [Artemia franciscana]|uniref:Uncharacterized protein n=1 Tax=Artemia franciscana TaxID=6661 RepID=A0AA88HEU7_ARTSF|nr:hypothetical protein QYM36_017526 [Artemia franciscana]
MQVPSVCFRLIVLELTSNLHWRTLPGAFSEVSGIDQITPEAKYHKNCIDKFISTKPKCDNLSDLNKRLLNQFLGMSIFKKWSIYYVSDLKEKLSKVLIENALVWPKHKVHWLKRSLNRNFGNQLINFVDSQKGIFYYLKGTVSSGIMAAQVKEMIKEFQYSGILIDSDHLIVTALIRM